MFENIGEKIKNVAKSYFIVMTIIGVVTGIVLLLVASDNSNADVLVISGLTTMVVTPLAAWLSALLLYGFGELIEKTTTIEFYLGESYKSGRAKQEEDLRKKNDEPAPVISNRKFSLETYSSDGAWRCSQCQTSNPSSRHTCKGCGLMKRH